MFTLDYSLEKTCKTQPIIMDTEYTSEEILAYLEGEKSEEDASRFWQTVEADERLRMDVEALRVLVEEGRKQRFRKFLKEVKDFDEGLPPIEGE